LDRRASTILNEVGVSDVAEEALAKANRLVRTALSDKSASGAAQLPDAGQKALD
jgi:hypothetical protein